MRREAVFCSTCETGYTQEADKKMRQKRYLVMVGNVPEDDSISLL